MLTSSAALIGDCQAASGAMNIAMAALAVRDGIAPALTGLARPVAGDLGRYLTDPVLPGPVEQALALTAAPGSVSGAVLLGGRYEHTALRRGRDRPAADDDAVRAPLGSTSTGRCRPRSYGRRWRSRCRRRRPTTTRTGAGW
ncbi:hypothetical protein ACFSTC_12150 [Nonomuraea ferruginea]